MGRHDWYRKTTWTEADRMDFWQHFKRARAAHSKSQYLRIQAHYLADTYPEEALELLDTILKDFPAAFDVAAVELQRGKILLRLGNTVQGLKAMEKSLEREKAFPNVQTQAWAAYGMAVVRNKRIDLYDVVEKLVLERIGKMLFPMERYEANVILALISHHRGNADDAVKQARAALKETGVAHSGFRYHADVGLVTDPDQEVLQKIKELAGENL